MMAEVMTTITTQTSAAAGDGSEAARPGDAPVERGSAEDTRTTVQMGALIAVVVIAYSYSLTTLWQLAGLNTPLAYVSLVPIVSLILAGVHSRPSQPEPAIHDRQTDYIVGVPLMVGALCANLFLPAKLSAMFWVWRIDLLTMPFFVAGAVAVIFGVRVLWRQKVAVAFLLLAWPYPYTSVLLGVLNGFTYGDVVRHHRDPPRRARGNAARRAEQHHLHGRPRWSPLQPQCDLGLLRCEQCGRVSPGRQRLCRHHSWTAGPEGRVAGCGDALALGAQPGPAHPRLLGGPALRRALRHRRPPPLHRARPVHVGCRRHDPVHPADGTPDRESRREAHCRRTSICRAAQDLGQRDKRNLAVPKVYLAVSLVLVLGIITGFSNVGLQTYNLVADVSGAPKVVSFINDPVTPVGWTARYQTTFKWAAPLFGEQSVWNRYELYPGVGGDLRARTEIVADVIDTPDLQTFAAFGVEQCYQFHGYSLANVTQMPLAGGITGQSLAYTSQQFGSWTIVYWILPVKRGASTVYERVVLYVQNQHGLIAQATRGQQAGIKNQAGVLGSNNAKQVVLLQNQDFLVAYAKEMIRDQASRSAGLLAQHVVA